MTKQLRADAEVKCILDGHQYQLPHSASRGPHGREEAESEREDQEQIDVAARNHFINGQLEVERSGNDEGFQKDRQNQNLNKRMCTASDLLPECRERQPLPL